MNYYPFHIGDYISHTSHLSDAEDLAYRRMIDLYYQTEEPFKDVAWVARRIKSTSEIVKLLLEEFFEFDSDVFFRRLLSRKLSMRLRQTRRASSKRCV